MKRIVGLTAVAIIVLSSLAWTQPRWKEKGSCDQPCWHQLGNAEHGCEAAMRGGRFGPGIILELADKISLTAAQKEKLEQMLVEFNLEKVDLQADLKKAQIKLQALMRDNAARETEVNSAIDEAARMKADLQKMRYRHRQEIRNLLTDKQIEQLKGLRQERRGMDRVPRHGRGPGGPGYGFDIDPDDDI